MHVKPVNLVIARCFVGLARVISGGSIRWSTRLDPHVQRVMFANHTSNLDFVALWASLPVAMRRHTRPVAAQDYWERNRLRRFVCANVFRAVLIPRGADVSYAPDALPAAEVGKEGVRRMVQALEAGDSLIIFPEGHRHQDDSVGAFKTGLYHLAVSRPGLEMVPVYMQNMNRILPKGEMLPVPLLGHVTIGAPIHLGEGEDKRVFLNRAREAIEELSRR